MLAKPFGSLVGSVEIESGTKKNQVYIKPKDAMTNEELTVEEFSQAGAQSSSKTYLAMFRVPDVKGLQKVTIKLPGKVKYVSSTCINVVDESTIEIVPVSLVANVMKQEYVLDEEGNFTYDDSGVVITTTVVERDVEVSCMFGYVAYEHSPNYALITVLCILGVGVVTFIVLGFVKGWFAKFFGIAPKLPVEESLS
jgi:hypothetical protein